MFKRKPILMGQSDLHQSQIIYELVGSPNDKSMPGWNKLPGSDVVKGWDAQPGSLEKKFRE
jgi:serine/threonine-protein kinase BUR1